MALLAGIAMTAVGLALLNKVLKGGIWPIKGPRGFKGQVIEIDEYEIIDDVENQASEGCKVEIH